MNGDLIKKKKISPVYFHKFLVIKTLEPDPLKVLDPDPDQMKTDPKHCP